MMIMRTLVITLIIINIVIYTYMDTFIKQDPIIIIFVINVSIIIIFTIITLMTFNIIIGMMALHTYMDMFIKQDPILYRS